MTYVYIYIYIHIINITKQNTQQTPTRQNSNTIHDISFINYDSTQTTTINNTKQPLNFLEIKIPEHRFNT